MTGSGSHVGAVLARLLARTPWTVAGLTAAVAAALAGTGRDEGQAAVLGGLRDGLAAPDGTLVWDHTLPADAAGPELSYRAAVLSGRILAALVEEVTDEAALLRAVGYASALATPQGQGPLLAGELRKAHLYASILCERHQGRLGDEEEARLARWLWARSGKAETAHDRAALDRLRQRRLAR